MKISSSRKENELSDINVRLAKVYDGLAIRLQLSQIQIELKLA